MRYSALLAGLVLPSVLLAACQAAESSQAPAQRDAGQRHAERRAAPAAPRPDIVPRRSWHADERLVREHASYTGKVRAVFIHHTNDSNTYDCADVPRMLQALQQDHVGRGWDDLGYNFLVDRCGNVYEGRSGGSDRPVRGAHTKGFNVDTVGIGAIGDFEGDQPVPRAMLKSIASVAAWKLRPGADPHGRTRLKSASDASRFDKGTRTSFHVIAGHRDAYQTTCPGAALYRELPQLRDMVVRLRSRE